MKIWMVMLIFGKIAVVAGPLPYGFGECQDRARKYNTEIDMQRFQGLPWADDFLVVCRIGEKPVLEIFE